MTAPLDRTRIQQMPAIQTLVRIPILGTALSTVARRCAGMSWTAVGMNILAARALFGRAALVPRHRQCVFVPAPLYAPLLALASVVQSVMVAAAPVIVIHLVLIVLPELVLV